MDVRVRGYRWILEYTLIEGHWSAKAFLGGMKRHDTKGHYSKEDAMRVIYMIVCDNNYFK